jgi:hypothetical protein
VWSTAAKNPYLGVQIELVREMGRMPSPPPTIALTIALSAPGSLEQALLKAGFLAPSVTVSPVPAPRNFPSVDEALGAMRANSLAQGELGQAMSEAEWAHYWAELERRLQAYVQADGTCVLDGEALLGVGTK